jgi:HNH endonuclease
MTYTVFRNNGWLDVPFWQLAATDLVLATDQRLYPINVFPELRALFPQLETPPIALPTLSDILRGIGKVFIVGITICAVVEAIASLLGPQRNNDPLTQRDRNYVRWRDGEICFYCKVYAPYGHVDHRTSRANGGSNDYDNLAWACASCNCSKGAMNDTEFMSLLWTRA